jgi:CubicO group peptidase (beta-lactamase class C family)
MTKTAVTIEGTVHPAFGAVTETLLRIVAKRPGGGAVCVYHRGEPVVDVWAGATDPQGAPWRRETLTTTFSTGKGVVSTALHILADRGLVDYDAPIARYWPEFAQADKARVTVRQLMCHESAMHRIRGVVPDAFALTDWDAMCDALAAQPVAWEPGTRNGYHGITYGWLTGAIVERVSGKRLTDFLHTELVEPLGLDGLFFGVAPQERHRLARLVTGRHAEGLAARGESPRVLETIQRLERFERMKPAIDAFYLPRFNELLDSDELQAAAIPAFNGAFTARSLARLYAMLARGGELDGTRILSPATVRHAATIQNTRPDAVVFFRLRWRLGYHLAGTLRGIVPNGFGHFGYGGSGAWCDPDTDLAVAFTTNTLAGTPMGDTRLLRLGAAALTCAERRRGS